MSINYPKPLHLCRDYLGSCGSIEEAIGRDTQELKAVSGSFEDMAEQLRRLLDFAARSEHPQYDDWRPLVEVVYGKFVREHGPRFDGNQNTWEEYGLERCRAIATLPETRYSNRIAVIDTFNIPFYEPCPFKICQSSLNVGEKVRLFNYFLGKRLTISEGTEHLVREHNFLPKAPGIGLTAAEFYAYFMPSMQEERRKVLYLLGQRGLVPALEEHPHHPPESDVNVTTTDISALVEPVVPVPAGSARGRVFLRDEKGRFRRGGNGVVATGSNGVVVAKHGPTREEADQIVRAVDTV